MDISLGIAVGSATQISLFVIPFCVVVSAMAGEQLTLDMGTFQAAVLFLSILITILAIQTGTSDWLKGALLLTSYLILSAAYWVLRAPDELTNEAKGVNRSDPGTWTGPARTTTGSG